MRPDALYARRLQVPTVDWGKVVGGVKTEFRMAGAKLLPQHVLVPQPVIGWRDRSPVTQLLVLEDCWTETLLGMSKESLQAEGFETFDEFRVYWRARYGSFKPLATAVAYKVRPLRDEDRDAWAVAMFERLFGEAREASPR